MVFSKKEVTDLVKKIKNPEDKKRAKLYLQRLVEIKSGTRKSQRRIQNEAEVKQALDFLIKVGLKIGEHALIEKFLHLFD